MIWKTSEKKNETEIQNKAKVHSSRLEQAEDRISELKDEMVIKRKTEELLVSQLKTYERNMQELTDSIKDQTLKSGALKKEKRCKQKEFVIYSTK
jgi:chromosome segregation ATPase